MTPDELIAHVAETVDPDLIVEILELSSEDLLEAFREEFLRKRDKFIEPNDDEEEEEESW
tara:strand:- start:2405 stop:2584 length:180 start_codon:yes stop_codon:yes gene_type:complete